MIQEATERISLMEQYFERLQKTEKENPAALREDPEVRAMLQALTGYYESGQWLRDYELDEKGLLPRDLKRGVLSQDAAYDFLDRIENNRQG